MRKLKYVLQKVVNEALIDDRELKLLRTEACRVLGPTVNVPGGVRELVEAANYELDILEMTGRSLQQGFRPSVVARLVTNKDASVRKFAARVAPQNYLQSMMYDRSPSVRSAVARRVPIGAVREMLKRFPNDDQLNVIYRRRKLVEAGLPTPKKDDEPLSLYGDEPMGDAVKQQDDELSDRWYAEKALRFVMDYGTNIEDAWERVLAKRYAASVKATSGVKVDEERLLKAIRKCLDDRDDRAMKRSALKETIDWLNSREDVEPLIEATTFATDPVNELMQKELSPTDFMNEAKQLFCIKEATMPASLVRHSEARVPFSIPVVAQVPNDHVRAIDESALDEYCRCWNASRKLVGEPFKLRWSNHPDSVNKVSFSVTLR